jgi:MerR HTH family regulatory protein
MISIPTLPKHEIERARAQAEAFPLISMQQVAKQYAVSLRTLRRWQAAGLMPPRTKHGKWLKYQKTAIAELMSAHQGLPL